jgi:hypothetical protein
MNHIEFAEQASAIRDAVASSLENLANNGSEFTDYGAVSVTARIYHNRETGAHAHAVSNDAGSYSWTRFD